MVGIRSDVMQQRRQCAISRAIGVHDLFWPAHIRRDVGVNTQRVFAIFMANRAAELVLVKLGNGAWQQWMLRFAFALFFREACHIQPYRSGRAEHQIDPVERFIGGQQRIALAGQRFSLFFVHRQNRDVFLQEGLPPLGVVGYHEFGTQRQNDRHIVFLRVLNRFHGGFRHRLAGFTAHQIRRQHQCRRARNHRFRNALCTQLIHVAGADGKGTFAGIADQRETAANRPVNALKVVQIGAAGGIAQVTVGVATNFDVAAHDAQ